MPLAPLLGMACRCIEGDDDHGGYDENGEDDDYTGGDGCTDCHDGDIDDGDGEMSMVVEVIVMV